LIWYAPLRYFKLYPQSNFMILRFIKSGYNKIKEAFSKARSLLSNKLRSLFQGNINENTLEQLEQLLYEADFGVTTATELTNRMKELYRKHPSFTTNDYINALKTELLRILHLHSTQLKELPIDQLPMILLVVGVNGNGKTTSTAKLAHLFKSQGKSVIVGAADTFRAAAIDQLTLWAERLEIDIVKGTPKSDPASVAFDAVAAGKARKCDVVIIDTAGRLHTKSHLMQELEKIGRSCKKASSSGPHETLLVLDATTGQNAIDQAKQFNQSTPITGIILTKVDGTAKGGIAVAIQRELSIPIKFIGTGEGIEDLTPFDAESFVDSLFD
jgi:fused signal recognition particle receptor